MKREELIRYLSSINALVSQGKHAVVLGDLNEGPSGAGTQAANLSLLFDNHIPLGPRRHGTVNRKFIADFFHIFMSPGTRSWQDFVENLELLGISAWGAPMAYTQTDPSSIEAAIIAFGKGERAGGVVIGETTHIIPDPGVASAFPIFLQTPLR